MTLDQTHAPDARSWVDSANGPTTDFPIQNLPLGIFRTADDASPRVGFAIGDRILDARAALDAGLFTGLSRAAMDALDARSLNDYLALAPADWTAIRLAAFTALLPDGLGARLDRQGVRLTVPQHEAELLLPAAIGDYTDFYASVHHATNVGSMFRPDNPLLPNYKWVPIGYHGRASSIVASGTPVHRPTGQTRDDADAPPSVGPSKRMDYEVEVGFWIGGSNALGTPVPIGEASQRIAGLCLLNDWSARDIQAWEYQPLGPFLAKNFASTISPWLVTADALAPFRTAPLPRAEGDPEPLPYLVDEADQRAGGIALQVDCLLLTTQMRAQGLAPFRVSRSDLRHLYWTPAQLVAHHTMNGCNLRPGDLLGSGTISGPEPESRACMLERTWRGTEPLQLPTGETRRFLEDGDEVILHARAERDGARTIGFGECRGTVVGA
jgi:fumarylacetoacetase